MCPRRMLLIALVVLLLVPVPVRAAINLDQNSNLAYSRAQEDNRRWKQGAVDREAELVKAGDEYLKKKEYDRAKRSYEDALDVTYVQWIIEGNRVTTGKREEKLNTGNTAKARQKLQNMDATRLADSQQEWKKQAQTILKQGDTALAQKNPVKAYSFYTQIINAADKQPKLKDGPTVDQAKKKQLDILKASSAMLDEAEKLLAAKKPTEAFAKLNEHRAAYNDLQNYIPDLKTRVQKLNNDPVILKEAQEQEVRKTMLIGDAAIAREDYVGALRRYQMAASMSPETDSSRQAAEKVTQLQNDPKFMEGLKKQEAESKSRLLFYQAETLRTQDKKEEAAAIYREILKEYPDASFAAQAQEALTQLETLPATDAAPADAPQEPPPAKDEPAE